MILTDNHAQRNQKYVVYAGKKAMSISKYPRVDEHNEIIILKKTS